MSVWRCRVTYIVQATDVNDALNARTTDRPILEEENADYVCDDATWTNIQARNLEAKTRRLHRKLAEEAIVLLNDLRRQTNNPTAGRYAEDLAKRVLEASLP